MNVTRCVPQTTHTEDKSSLGAMVNITANSRKVYLYFSTVVTPKLLTIFTHILKNKSNKADKLTTAGRSRMTRQLLNKMTIISVN
jgi:hypothetical protein